MEKENTSNSMGEIVSRVCYNFAQGFLQYLLVAMRNPRLKNGKIAYSTLNQTHRIRSN